MSAPLDLERTVQQDHALIRDILDVVSVSEAKLNRVDNRTTQLTTDMREVKSVQREQGDQLNRIEAQLEVLVSLLRKQ